MHIETLNVWGGRVYEPLMDHLQTQRDSVDVFCFQEVCDTPTGRIYTRDPLEGVARYSDDYPGRADMLQRLADALPDHRGLYRPNQEGQDFAGKVEYPLQFGLAMFVHKEIQIIDETETYVFGLPNSQSAGDSATLGRNMQHAKLVGEDGQHLVVAHIHGLWSPEGKVDTPDRLGQSERIIQALAPMLRTVVCGDLNLNPDTQSMALLRDSGLRDLVSEYEVPTTRTCYYKQPVGFGTYVLTSYDLSVEDFVALPDEVSDHRALAVKVS